LSLLLTHFAPSHPSTLLFPSADIASDLKQLSPALDMLAQSETELSLPLTHFAATLDSIKELHLARVHSEHVSGLSALLGFNTGMAAALNEVRMGLRG
jgi:hypothetical protein